MGRGHRGKEQQRCKGLTLRAIRLLQLGLVGSVHSAQPLSIRWWCGMDRPKGQDQAHLCRRPCQGGADRSRGRCRPRGRSASAKCSEQLHTRVSWVHTQSSTLHLFIKSSSNGPERHIVAGPTRGQRTTAMARPRSLLSAAGTASVGGVEICTNYWDFVPIVGTWACNRFWSEVVG